MGATNFQEPDFFTDRSVLLDPYGALAEVRDQAPVLHMKHHDYVMVTGFREAAAVLLDGEHFSSVIAAAGPTAPLPFVPEGSSAMSRSCPTTAPTIRHGARCSTGCSPHRGSRQTSSTCTTWPTAWCAMPWPRANAR
jgi:hypothetical protein